MCLLSHPLHSFVYKNERGRWRGRDCVCMYPHFKCVEEASHCIVSASCPRNLCVGGIRLGVVAVLLSGQEVVTISLLTTHWPIQMWRGWLQLLHMPHGTLVWSPSV